MATHSVAPEVQSELPRCLLVLPLGFYAFGHTLRRELELRGMQVVMENDEFPISMLGKVMGKLGALNLLRRFTLKAFIKRYGDGGRHFDLVIIIKGRGVGNELIAFLRSIARRLVAYNFDSFRFNPSPLDWWQGVHRYCTFDIEDAREHHLPLVHLFSAIPTGMALGQKKYDISVLMKNHSERLAYTDQILTALPGLSSFTYIFEPYLLSFMFGLLRTPRLYLKYWKSIHFRPLPYQDFLRVLSESRVTADYAHPSQSGITIRCFEARSVGAAIVTNNAHVFCHPSFSTQTVVHFPLGGNALQLAADVRRLLDEAPSSSVRSVADFMSDLLGETASAVVTTPSASLK